jgi:hypothetical protein
MIDAARYRIRPAHPNRVVAALTARWWIAASCLLAACQVDIEPPLHVENGTELVVNVFVNDQLVGEYGAMAVGDADVGLPLLPWRVEARTDTGRLLTSFDVAVGDVRTERGPNNEATYQSGALGRVDLSCGRLSVWVGDFVPSGPAPGPDPGTPGDCEP